MSPACRGGGADEAAPVNNLACSFLVDLFRQVMFPPQISVTAPERAKGITGTASVSASSIEVLEMAGGLNLSRTADTKDRVGAGKA